MPDRPTIAAFDVDGTLTVRDCVVPFLRRVAGSGTLSRRMLARAHLVMPAAARRDRDRMKAIATRAALAGVDEQRLHAEAEQFGEVVAAGWLRSDTLARLNWHRAHGHSVALVSASYEVYLNVIGARLGVAVALGTRLVSADGRLTGDLDGPNCRGREKVQRLHSWLDAAYGGRAAVDVWAYGDSAGDRELLADADHPVWVRDTLSSVEPS